MKLKDATLLAIIGVVIKLIPAIISFLVNVEILSYIDPVTEKPYSYFNYLGICNIIGLSLLLSFFITLFLKQK